jgi:hypothetical protein
MTLVKLDSLGLTTEYVASIMRPLEFEAADTAGILGPDRLCYYLNHAETRNKAAQDKIVEVLDVLYLFRDKCVVPCHEWVPCLKAPGMERAIQAARSANRETARIVQSCCQKFPGGRPSLSLPPHTSFCFDAKPPSIIRFSEGPGAFLRYLLGCSTCFRPAIIARYNGWADRLPYSS